MLRCFSVVLLAFPLLAQSPSKRPLSLADLERIQQVGRPEMSPDGQWIAYTVSTVDKENDKSLSEIWMVSWDGKQSIQLTFPPETASSPKWSPDGRYLSFTSSRPGKAKGNQVWLLDRRGGEAHQLTEVKENLGEYAWSPDSSRLLLVLAEKDEPDADVKPGAPPKPPKPIVIDRYHFKQDTEGYLHSPHHKRIWLFDVSTRKTVPLTAGKDRDEDNPAWSPDGTRIAFVANYDEDPDRSRNSDVFVADAKSGSTPRQLTNYAGEDSGPLSWSPDGKLIAYLQGTDPKYSAYNQMRLAVVPADGGPARLLSEKLDRSVASPVFTADNTVVGLVTDDQSRYPAVFSVSGGNTERLLPGQLTVMAISRKAGHTAALVSNDTAPPEIYALEGSSPRKLSSHNDALLSELELAPTEEIRFKDKQGIEVHGLLSRPLHYQAGQRVPTLLRIHGGPNGQDDHAFNFERQFFAANGYAVFHVNYRGSSGRGRKFQESIFADWGHFEVEDLLAGTDEVVRMGVADPDRLGIGGWSYGGILTDYTIASDTRFKAAISGAGSANQISMYGHDEYTLQYDNEIGPPWKAADAWVKISYPFFHADRIKTPTLFMGGDKDFNVPLAGGEQMYQALRSIGTPTGLIVYPGEFHGFKRPSFIRDRYERYLAWYDKYLKPAPAKTQIAQQLRCEAQVGRTDETGASTSFGHY